VINNESVAASTRPSGNQRASSGTPDAIGRDQLAKRPAAYGCVRLGAARNHRSTRHPGQLRGRATRIYIDGTTAPTRCLTTASETSAAATASRSTSTAPKVERRQQRNFHHISFTRCPRTAHRILSRTTTRTASSYTTTGEQASSVRRHSLQSHATRLRGAEDPTQDLLRHQLNAANTDLRLASPTTGTVLWDCAPGNKSLAGTKHAAPRRGMGLDLVCVSASGQHETIYYEQARPPPWVAAVTHREPRPLPVDLRTQRDDFQLARQVTAWASRAQREVDSSHPKTTTSSARPSAASRQYSRVLDTNEAGAFSRAPPRFEP